MSLPEDLIDVRVFIENVETKRYLFADGEPMEGERGDEGGWLESSGFQSPNMVGADANYYNRAHFKIVPSGDHYLLVNEETQRYCFADGEPIKGDRGDEGGWLESSGFEAPCAVGADDNYYNRALWSIVSAGDGYIIENVETKRYLFMDGEPIPGDRGDEGGWLESSGFESPAAKCTDDNYYGRAVWNIVPVDDVVEERTTELPAELVDVRVLIENVETKRYLFADGEPIEGERGDEAGWLESSGFQAPKMVGADANYYNRAYFKLTPVENYYLLVNEETKRYCLSDGEAISGKRGDEGGWLESSGFEAPCAVGSDENYYFRAEWKVVPAGDGYMFENRETKRYLFADGEPMEGERGDEGGWLESSGFASPDVKCTDDNYYGRAVWKITAV